MRKYEQYIQRLLKERPTHTKGGYPVEIGPEGKHVKTHTGRDWYGNGYSLYLPLDYPALFGWDRGPDPRKQKPPLLIKHRGHKYLRIK